MLVMLSVSLALVAVAIVATAKVTQVVMARLRLDSTTVLLWLGLAEWDSKPRARPVERRLRQWTVRRQRRSPHHRLERPNARRRPYSV